MSHKKKYGNTPVVFTPTDIVQNIRPKTQNQRQLFEALKRGTITLVRGPSGSGKTLIPIYYGLVALANNEVSNLIISRPPVDCGHHMGYFPGNEQEKILPYLRPILDILIDLIGKKLTEHMIETGVIDISPIGLARGRTFNNSYVILTESQNCVPSELLMWLTRLGQNCKMVIEGDINQSDLHKNGNMFSSCFSKLDGINGIELVSLTEEDIVRNTLIKVILQRLGQ